MLLFEGSITLLVPLIEAVQTQEDKKKFPTMYRKVILGIVSFYAFFGVVCWMAIGDSVRTVMTTSLPPGTLATMIQLAYTLAVVFTFPLQNFPSLEIVCSTLRNLPPATLSKVEYLTSADVQIYTTALRNFIGEMAWLESDAALGRRVICPDVLERWEPELAYLDGGTFNITQLYQDAL